jgi:hypothetical protein
MGLGAIAVGLDLLHPLRPGEEPSHGQTKQAQFTLNRALIKMRDQIGVVLERKANELKGELARLTGRDASGNGRVGIHGGASAHSLRWCSSYYGISPLNQRDPIRRLSDQLMVSRNCPKSAASSGSLLSGALR